VSRARGQIACADSLRGDSAIRLCTVLRLTMRYRRDATRCAMSSAEIGDARRSARAIRPRKELVQVSAEQLINCCTHDRVVFNNPNKLSEGRCR